MPIIIHFHFNPDPAACASFAYKTPPYASYLRPTYLFNGPYLRDIQGFASSILSSRTKSIYIAGRGSSIATNIGVVTSPDAGFVHAVRLE